MNRAPTASRSGKVVLGFFALLAVADARSPRADDAAQAPAVRRSSHAAHVRAAGLDRRVALLANALALDAGQQAAVRRLLVDEHEQSRRIWSDAAAPSAQRIAATRALSKHTADRIRALLNPEQRNRYEPSPEAGPAQAVADAHLEDWMAKRNAAQPAPTAMAAGAGQDAR